MFVGANKMNVFYIGVDNPITVAVPGYKCSDLTARLVGEGQITVLGDCRHLVVVKSVFKFQCRGESEQILFQTRQNFDFDAQCMITRFNIVLQRDSSDIVEHVVTGNTVPAKILDQAEKLPVGSRLYLVDVRTLCPGDTAPRNIGNVVYRISQ
ncbi:MAG: GldM family protein [Saprospiraceae bacterium]